MIALIRIALSRPYTFVVLALLILIAGGLSWRKMPTDIFPNIGNSRHLGCMAVHRHGSGRHLRGASSTTSSAASAIRSTTSSTLNRSRSPPMAS